LTRTGFTLIGAAGSDSASTPAAIARRLAGVSARHLIILFFVPDARTAYSCGRAKIETSMGGSIFLGRWGDAG